MKWIIAGIFFFERYFICFEKGQLKCRSLFRLPIKTGCVKNERTNPKTTFDSFFSRIFVSQNSFTKCKFFHFTQNAIFSRMENVLFFSKELFKIWKITEVILNVASYSKQTWFVFLIDTIMMLECYSKVFWWRLFIIYDISSDILRRYKVIHTLYKIIKKILVRK